MLLKCVCVCVSLSLSLIVRSNQGSRRWVSSNPLDSFPTFVSAFLQGLVHLKVENRLPCKREKPDEEQVEEEKPCRRC